MARTKAQKGRGKDTPREVPADDRQHRATPGMIEWIAGGVSAAITAAMIGFLLFQAFSVSTAVPQLDATVEGIRASGDTFHLEFRIVNRGEATAAGVLVRGRLSNGSEVIEEREVTFDYIPAHSENRGALLFRNDPRSYQLQLEPQGYKEP